MPRACHSAPAGRPSNWFVEVRTAAGTPPPAPHDRTGLQGRRQATMAVRQHRPAIVLSNSAGRSACRARWAAKVMASEGRGTPSRVAAWSLTTIGIADRNQRTGSPAAGPGGPGATRRRTPRLSEGSPGVALWEGDRQPAKAHCAASREASSCDRTTSGALHPMPHRHRQRRRP